jgi:predicted negative regulator of RcsB-dependent stress response
VGILIGYFAYAKYKENKKIEISNQYNSAVTEYSEENKERIKNLLVDLVFKNDPTYSPLSLYFIIDNKLITEKSKINDLFDNIIKEVSLDNEIKNLIIYKKALYNADSSEENELLEILKPITNSDSIWKSQALYLIAEYFYSKDEKQKSKEFFNQILQLENSNSDIVTEAQKRLNRDLSD